MSEILVSVLSVTVTTVIIPLIIYLGQRLAKLLKIKTEGEKIAALNDEATSIVQDVLMMISQTVVDGLKFKGCFTEDAQKETLEKAKSIVKANMSKGLQDFLTSRYSNLDRWIEIKIESILYATKNQIDLQA